jgi:tetratricopeptide (TPR) repeat protein
VRAILKIVSCCLAVLAMAGPARAGLVNSEEPLQNLPMPTELRARLGMLRSCVGQDGKPVPAPQPGTLPFVYRSQMDRLEGLRKERHLTSAEIADLAACYIRFRRFPEAVDLLKGAPEPTFATYSNLAVAYAEQGEYALAFREQQQAMKCYPDVLLGHSSVQLHFYRQVDTCFERLLRARAQEQLRSGGRGSGGKVPLDPLFPGVSFVGPDKTYEAGTLAPEMFDRLPDNAAVLVTQLLLWKPQDERLVWYAAELFNAYGQVDVASDLLAQMEFSGQTSFQGLHEHRQILREGSQVYRALFPRSSEPDEARKAAVTRLSLLAALAPPGLSTPAGVGGAALAVGHFASPTMAAKIQPEPPPPTPPQPVLPFEWRHVTVGFLTGCVVSILVSFQWQEWRRRRSAASAAGPPPEREPASSVQTPADG